VAGPSGPGPASVEIPEDYSALRARHPELAAAWRQAVRSAMSACFDAGLIALGFQRDGGSYLFGPEEAA
jgi:predicted GNAT superfamily acetyltransferase